MHTRHDRLRVSHFGAVDVQRLADRYRFQPLPLHNRGSNLHWLRSPVIPSVAWRRIVVMLALLACGGSLMWWSGRVAGSVPMQSFLQTVSGLVFLLFFYATGPLVGRFLSGGRPPTFEQRLRVDRALASLPHVRAPVKLYAHPDPDAVTVGLDPKVSRIFITGSLVDKLSDAGLRGVIAHEFAHAGMRHIAGSFAFALCFSLGCYATQSPVVFVCGLLIFLSLRRYFEYQADGAAAGAVGVTTMLIALQELHELYPSRRWHRWVAALTTYPTLPMRIQALITGKRQLF